MVFNVINSLTNSTKTEPNQDSLIRYLEEEHNRASNLNYIADIHISSIDKKNQVIAEIDCKLPFPSKSEITTFVTDFVNGGETQKGKTRKISLPFRKSDETAPTETPTPTEPTPVAPTTETAPTEAPTPTEPTPVAPTTETAPTETPTPTGPTPVAPTTGTAPTEAPKKTGTYQAPASQPKNTKTVSTETPKSAEYTNGELPTTGAISTAPWSILGVFSLLTSLLVFKKKYN